MYLSLIPRIGLGLCSTLLLLAACDPAEEHTEHASLAVEEEASWRAGLDAEIESLRTARPELTSTLASLQPRKTRAGFYRFNYEVVETPDATPFLLRALADEKDSLEYRRACADALSRSRGSYARYLRPLFLREEDPTIRSLLLRAAAKATPKEASSLLELAVDDASDGVRATALRQIAAHPQGERFSEALLLALNDDAASVRSEAAKALGVLSLSEAGPSLRARLGDDDPDVRLSALRSLDRLSLPPREESLSRLAEDSDPRIVRAARRIAERR